MSEFNINEDAQSGNEPPSSQMSNDNEPQSSTSQQNESAFPDEDEETITMLDVIEREDKLEEEASAVLGNSDEKNCTYPRGYISRQALYSCATCSDGPDKMAAICLACSLECHENHELIELYTKRNYRCDCGNGKFGSDFECKLMDKHSKKLPSNENNKYNHNFVGRYCICDKRYPPDEADDSAESNDDMWQCIGCEDWFHTTHLGAKEIPTKFDELICGSCVDKLQFVHYYKDVEKLDSDSNSKQGSSDNFPAQKLNETKALTQEKLQSEPPALEVDTGGHPAPVDGVTSSARVKTEVSQAGASNNCESDTNDSQAENKDPIRRLAGASSNSTNVECLLEKLKRAHDMRLQNSEPTPSAENTSQGPVFWVDCTWRSKLCRCPDCMTMYKTKECEYLLDDKDTVQYYEAQGRAIARNRESPFERGMSALNGMNRAAVVEALHGYDELKADLSSYLRKFADTKKVVREQDIHDFFQQLKSKKRPRLEYE